MVPNAFSPAVGGRFQFGAIVDEVQETDGGLVIRVTFQEPQYRGQRRIGFAARTVVLTAALNSLCFHHTLPMRLSAGQLIQARGYTTSDETGTTSAIMVLR